LTASTTYWLGFTRTETLPMISGAVSANSTNETSAFGWTVGDEMFLDGASAGLGPMKISVEAVPEPSTYAMLSVAALAGVWQLRRRRRAAANEKNQAAA